MEDPHVMLELLRRKEEDLDSTHDEECKEVFTPEALYLMQQNYMILLKHEYMNDIDESRRPIQYRMHVQTPSEGNCTDQSQRAKYGTRQAIKLTDMATRAASQQGIPPCDYGYIKAIYVEDVINDTDTDCKLECMINDKNIGTHFDSRAVSRPSDSAPSLCVVPAKQRMHLANGGRLIYGSDDDYSPIDKTMVNRYAALLPKNSILALTNVAPGSTVIEYTSPTARIRGTEDSARLTCGDHFVNLIYKHPKLFDKKNKVCVIETPGEDGNNIFNLRMPKKNFDHLHEKIQEQLLDGLRAHLLSMNDARPAVFKIIPVAEPPLSTANETDRLQNGAIIESGAAAWNTNELRTETGAVSFGLRVVMQPV